MGYSINTASHHYIEWYTWDHTTGTRGEYVDAELYDRLNDPNETVNLTDTEEQEETVKTLAEQLKNGWRESIAHQWSNTAP